MTAPSKKKRIAGAPGGRGAAEAASGADAQEYVIEKGFFIDVVFIGSLLKQ